ncbi:DNA-3-methyladenine glycosylase 2 family protein [archaeon]|nr:DNA-3-methyladenine glycosylase 2 family protein [archaeon]
MEPLHLIAKTVVRVQPPYRFDLTAAAYSFPWQFDGHRLLLASWEEGLATVAEVGPQQEEWLPISIYANVQLSGRELRRMVQDLVFGIGAKEDLTSFYRKIRNDPLLRDVVNRFHGMHMRARPDLWEALIIAILNQNTSFVRGWSMIANLYASLGHRLLLPDGRKTIALPRPGEVLEAGPSALKKCGVGYRAQTLIAVAEALEQDQIQTGHLRRASDHKALEELLSIRGIGAYSASLALLIAHRRYRMLPIDRWLTRIIPHFYHIPKPVLTRKELDEFATRRWGNWRGLSVFFMTIVTEARTARELLGQRKPLSRLTPLTLWQRLPATS